MGTETPISNVLAKISMNEDTVDKSSKNEVTVDKTDMDAVILEATTIRIINGTISAKKIELLEAFVKGSKTGLIRQELQVWSRTVLEGFFENLAKAEPMSSFSMCMSKKPSDGGNSLAKDVCLYMSKDKEITDFDTLEILLETLMEGHSDAVSWKPETGKEQEALMQYITGDCARFWIGNSGVLKLAPGFWLMLKIRQELCAHILSSDNF
jgi:hypothetical protein